jgi:hypothetical protein
MRWALATLCLLAACQSGPDDLAPDQVAAIDRALTGLRGNGSAKEADMHTKDFLAQELRKAGLEAMASEAERGHYHDYLSPLPFPDLQLDADLVEAIKGGNEAAKDLRRRHHAGEFDASNEESDEWAESEDGRRAFDLLRQDLKGKP